MHGSRGVLGGQAAFWEYPVEEVRLPSREPLRLVTDAHARPKRVGVVMSVEGSERVRDGEVEGWRCGWGRFRRRWRVGGVDGEVSKAVEVQGGGGSAMGKEGGGGDGEEEG